MADTTSPRPGEESSAREQDADHAAIRDWLTQAHPALRRPEWARHGVTILPLGIRFDALRIPAPRVHTAVGSSDTATVDVALRAQLHGPVVRDTRTDCYYVLVAPGATWDGPGARLTSGTFVAVPRSHHQASPVTWAVPPQHRDDLCDPADLAALLALAVES
ncbi:hypothetical protein [Streptomyces silvensis]|uniref:DNA primase/polymerase bifunctional N-terminal domain-containing protein n=1 Tax=Streptomyces silvensis TaxID=1765722 RepID=A0A0W7WYJ3_9ACTN|nr:hypothetical protein [Streptomyces silvensis]KUF15641.1 hypothetical protein AT728_12860 [Streptomyces silvensis]